MIVFNMKIYKAKKIGPTIFLITVYFVVLALMFFNDPTDFFQKSHWIFPAILPLALGLWSLLHTYYKIQGNKLIYRSGYIYGEIDIKSIKEIIKGKTRWIGQKPALATGGLIIKYNSFDDVYLAPKNSDELIEDLLEMNGNIILTENIVA